MKFKNLIGLLTLIFIFVFTIDVNAQRKKRKKNGKKTETSQIAKTNSKPKPKKGAIQPYDKVVTKDMKTDKGLFKVHSDNQKYLFEIPDTLLGREMLMVTRIAKTASNLGYGGSKSNTQVLRWQKKGKNILLRIVSHAVTADTILPVNNAVVNSNFEPILFSFPIKAFNKDSTGVVIDGTTILTTDLKPLGLPQFRRTQHRVTRMDKTRSYIERISSYPQNIEFRHVKTYLSSKPPSNSSLGSISIEMSNSMILLPKVPMKRRYFDRRVGWWSRGQIDYGLDEQKSKAVRYIDRWRLEVKDEDIEKFKRGELVEPKKQIVYYIDPATPKKWRKYIKQGIEDWQVAFEAAGFKNAIIAKDPPTKEEDPDWSPEDIRYSVVRYLASTIPNASGPHVSDPRSGEILESDIQWYHNVMTLLHDWFFIQTGAINPEARKNKFKDEIMGRLIRFVSSHEVGHTIGLPHNMGSSVAFPVDSLRSDNFTKKYGISPSIMDYARFNYVAQPEDNISTYMPKIGIYDKYAISWGYRPILDKSADEEKPILNDWILKHANDPLYRFGHQQVGNLFTSVVDPSSQTEDIGDNSMKASSYGIKNLKRILKNLDKWTVKKGDSYDELSKMYNSLFGQYYRYMGHVIANIGGVYENHKTRNQQGAIYTHVDKIKQKEAVSFLNKELFKTPTWLLDNEIFNKVQFSGVQQRMRGIHADAVNGILDPGRMIRILENETVNGNKAFTLTSLFYHLRQGIWSEIYAGKSIDAHRRNLQRAYIDRLDFLLNKAKNQSGINAGYFKRSSVNMSQSDIKAMVRGELNRLKRDVKSNLSKVSNTRSRYHLRDIIVRIESALDPK